MAHIRSAVLVSVLFVLVPLIAFGGTGVLEVRSEPSGAHVTIDGVDAGTTPYQNIEMPIGKHRIRATLGSEYPPLVQEVVINELAPQVILFKFVKQRKKGAFVSKETVLTTEEYTGNVIFVSMPTGASVVVDGLPRKSTPIGYTDIEVGKYSVKFILGKRTLQSDFEVVQGETIKVIAEFDKGKVFNTANEAKKRAAKKKKAKRDESMQAEAEQAPLSPEMAATAPGTPDMAEEERATTETVTPESAAPVVETAGTATTEKAAPAVVSAATVTPEKAAPAVVSAGTATTEKAAPAMATAGTVTTGGATVALETPQPEQIPPPGEKPEAAAVQPQHIAWPTPFGELAITVNVSRDAGMKYSDYFIITFPKVPIKSLAGSLFPKASKDDESVLQDNVEYFNDADSNTRQFAASVHFDPTMTVLAYSGAHSEIMTVKKGTYDLEITRREILKHFVPDEKLIDETAREELEIVPGNRLLVQIDGHIGADKKLSYEIKRTYVAMDKKSSGTGDVPAKKSEQGQPFGKSGTSEQTALPFLSGGQN